MRTDLTVPPGSASALCGPMRPRLASILALAGLALASCADNDTGAQLDAGMSGAQTGEAGLDGGEPAPDLDTGAPEGEGDADAESDSDGAGESGLPPTPGMPCERDEDCDDDLLCNGAERCEPVDEQHSVCRPGTPVPCSAEHPCLEETSGCDCRDDDRDDDGSPARICVPDAQKDKADCEDGNAAVHPKAIEVCDPQDRDEDCNPETFNAPGAPGLRGGDRDQDGYVSAECGNFHPVLGKRMQGDDCDDANDAVHPRNSEVCNYIDDDCNGLVDEQPVKDGDPIKLGLRAKLYPDFDQDQYANMQATPRLECDFNIPRGYVFATPHDCDDRPQFGVPSHPTAPERCDGVDNDCDGTVDEPGDMTPPADVEGTTFECTNGGWITHCPADNTKLWCDGDEIAKGCVRDGTRLKSCRACVTDCQFSCGQTGCDEVVQMAAGHEHACALTREGRVACWGRGGLGRLGTDSLNSTSTPTLLTGPLPPAHLVAAGNEHSCAVAGRARTLYCWGSNATGQLGSDAVALGSFSTTFVAVSLGNTAFLTGSTETALSAVSDVALAPQHSCAVLATGHVACWGEQTDGRLGTNRGTTGAQRFPGLARRATGVINNASTVTVGAKHSCILTTTGRVECWGDNTYGQLGQDPAAIVNSPVATPVPELTSVTAIAAGTYHTCAVAEGQVVCWGDNGRLQLGRVTTPATIDYRPLPVSGSEGAVSLQAGATHSCAIAGDRALLCWGAGNYGQLGDPALIDRANPRPVSVQGVQTMTLGSQFTCAIGTGSRTLCWGSDFYGQLGRGESDANPRPSPTAIRALHDSRP